ncbi:putative integral inner membrane protein [Legionella steigerwaltii]|uniref:TVP38/TMEM64 family membrane protein n=1 Tax=Legionella steigerwaltii TaxID=460 RepID=A0A378LBP9_9GAMM|nr:VTT domain-containing protein [Legionella steigerwaltii]KTD77815.1 putative integral inner membrane protein [Legionella steigerwaltii]STY24455.1 putative integral inner membrane protein [Legionella steigerwaltii]
MTKWLRSVFIFTVISFFIWELHCHMPILIQGVQELGTYSFIGFFILYCFTMLLFLPIEPIVLASGAMFGFYYGFLIALFCAVVSAAIAFIISRYLGLYWLPRGKNKLLAQWLERLESFGWKSLAVARLTPFLPCSIVNYGYGLTNIRLFVYTITNLIFFIPYKLIITYIGSHL